MRTQKVPKNTKGKDSKRSSDSGKRPERKLARMGTRELNHWPKEAQKLNAKLDQMVAERTTELRALNRELSFKAAKLEQKLSEFRQIQKKLNHLASFPEMNPNPVVEVIADGSIEYLNPAAKKLFPDLEDMGHQHKWLVDLESIYTLLKDQKKTSYVREINIDSAWFEQLFFLAPEQDRIRIYGRDITERKHAEQALEAARIEAVNEKNRLEAIMETLPVGVAMVDAQGGNIRSNSAFEHVWGGPRPAALSVTDYAAYKAWWSETGKPVAPEEWASAQAVQKGRAVVGQLLEIQRFDGSRASVINSGIPIFDANGKIAGCAVAIQDITDLRKAEQALQESESKYRSLFSNMVNAFGYHKVLCDDQGKPIDYVFLEVNGAFEKLTGLKKENVIGRKVTEVLPGIEKDPADWIGTYGKVARTGEPIRFENYLETLKKWYSISAYRPEKGHFAVVFEDITERKRMEEELRKSRDELEMRVKQRTAELVKANELLEGMFSGVDTMIAYMNKDFNFIRVNRAYAEADERQPEFFVGKNHFMLFPNEENEQIFRTVVDTGEPYSVYGKLFEYAEHPERGATYWDWSLQPVKEPDGSIGGVVLSLVNVTERIRAEESVHQQAALLELAHDAIIVRDMEDRVLFWNRSAEQMYGWRKDEALGAGIHDLLQTQYPKLSDEIKIDLIRNGQWEGELLHTRHDGKKIIVESRWALQRGKEGRPTVILQINRDITERKRAQEAVETERQRFNDVLEILPAYLVLLSPDYHVPFANRFFRERFGESHGQRCFEYLFGRSEPCETCESYTALKTMAPHKWEWTGPDGRNYDVFDFPFTDTDGSVLILEMGIDITERKQAQEALKGASLYTRSLIEASLDPLVTISADGKIMDVNNATELVTGVSREGLIGTDFSDYFTEPKKARKGYEEVFSKGFVRDYPLAIRHTSDKVTDVLYHATVYRNEAGEIQGVFAAARDITELMRTQDALRAASLYTRSLIEASLDPLVTISLDGKIMDVNEATELVTGVFREQLIGTDFSNYFTEPDKAREGYQQVFLKGSVKDYPLAIRHVSGKVTDVLYHATVYKNEVGEIQGVFAAARDITARKRAEEALRESENRLRLLSSQLINVQESERKRIAREIHDSIGQTLAAIKFGLESKLSQMGGGAAPPGVSIENIISLTQSGIEESRRIQMDLRPSVLDDLGILATIGWFTREFQKVYVHISVEKHISVEENEIPDSLRTVLFRVMQEAMNNVAKHSKADLVHLTLRKTADKIELSIKDNGAGFDPETIKQGLGLTSMRERTELSGGTFEIESTVGKGTTIRASWPI